MKVKNHPRTAEGKAGDPPSAQPQPHPVHGRRGGAAPPCRPPFGLRSMAGSTRCLAEMLGMGEGHLQNIIGGRRPSPRRRRSRREAGAGVTVDRLLGRARLRGALPASAGGADEAPAEGGRTPACRTTSPEEADDGGDPRRARDRPGDARRHPEARPPRRGGRGVAQRLERRPTGALPARPAGQAARRACGSGSTASRGASPRTTSTARTCAAPCSIRRRSGCCASPSASTCTPRSRRARCSTPWPACRTGKVEALLSVDAPEALAAYAKRRRMNSSTAASQAPDRPGGARAEAQEVAPMSDRAECRAHQGRPAAGGAPRLRPLRKWRAIRN